MKKFIRRAINWVGYDIIRKRQALSPANASRPVGNIEYFLEDIRARGLITKLIFDIGANNCNWSRRAKRIFPESDFVLVEPQTEMEGHMRSFCSDFPGSAYFLAGAGARKEKKYLTVWEDLVGSSFLPEESDELVKSGKQREIDILTIDGIIEDQKFRVPGIIKLDIQGYELEALKGAEKTFGITELYILEVSMFPFDDIPGVPVFNEVVEFMLKRGYVVYDFSGFMRRPADGALGQCDVCFVKRKGIFRRSNSWNG